MINRIPSGTYYKPKEVQNKLGITESALRNLVRTEQLHKITPPGKKHTVYLREEVDSFLLRWLAFLSTEKPKGVEFMKATREDQEEEYSLAKHIFGPATHDLETRYKWFDKNSETDFVVKHNDKIVAYMNVLPVKHQVIMDFMEGKIRGWEITSDDVEKPEPGKPIEYIIMAMATTPDETEQTRKEYSYVLLRGMEEMLEEMGEKGLNITNVYATSATTSGIGILMHAGFLETGKRFGKRIAFALDVKQARLPVLRRYQEAYSKWEKKNEGPSK